MIKIINVINTKIVYEYFRLILPEANGLVIFLIGCNLSLFISNISFNTYINEDIKQNVKNTINKSKYSVRSKKYPEKINGKKNNYVFQPIF